MSTLDEVLFVKTLSPLPRTDGTANGSSVDRMVNGGMQDAVVLVSTGTVTDGSHALSVQDSDNGTTGWTAVSAAQMQGSAPTIAAGQNDTVFQFGVRASRRFLRVVAVSTGATVGGTFAAAVLLGQPRNSPVSR